MCGGISYLHAGAKKFYEQKIFEGISKILDRKNFKVKINEYENSLDFSITEVKKVSDKISYVSNIACFSLQDFPNLDAVIFYNMVVVDEYQHKGIATFLQKIKEEICSDCGIDTMFCTVNSSNEIQKKVLFNNGWTLFGLVKQEVEMWKKTIKEN